MRKIKSEIVTHATAKYGSRSVASMNLSTAASCSPRAAWMRPRFERMMDDFGIRCVNEGMRQSHAGT
jgi:hypothetical protein